MPRSPAGDSPTGAAGSLAGGVAVRQTARASPAPRSAAQRRQVQTVLGSF